ncbi:MAG: tripartite tricarboxylate transporter substrate binding protein, partial [Coriobacteriia bacterium]|nr:tripartite tricarboxylate transporter substrate binding protein [Coriobacteriia bacterium]
GGGNDILARAVGQRLSPIIGQQIIIDNRGGAGGQLGAELAAKADPDGYTIFLGSIGNLTFLPVLQARLPYDPVRDFAPVTLLATSAFILVVNPEVPAKSLKEFIALAKAKPGQLNYGSAGSGSSLHMTAELFKLETRLDIAHVPYKGTSPALIDLLANQVQMMFSTMPTMVPHVKSGKLRALGVSSTTRAEALPDVPTVAEAGLPGFDVLNWQGVVVPKKTPDAIVQKLSRALLTTLKSPEMIKALATQGLDAAGGTPEQFGALIKSEIEKYAKVAKEAKLRLE